MVFANPELKKIANSIVDSLSLGKICGASIHLAIEEKALVPKEAFNH